MIEADKPIVPAMTADGGPLEALRATVDKGELLPVTQNFAEIVGHLASGGWLRYTDDYVELVLPVKQPDGPTFTRLIHHGWLVSTPGCGGYRLSDEGLKAYLRSTDELQNVGLVDPHGYRP